MKLIDLKPKRGSRRKPKEVGRGRASGHGKTCCMGHNGQKQRAGFGMRTGFEGGQTPTYRRLPKFQTNERSNKRFFCIINLRDIEKLRASGCKSEQITPEILLEKGIIKDVKDGIRVLGDGNINFPLVIKANHFSKSAREKIEKAGGKCEIISVSSSKKIR